MPQSMRSTLVISAMLSILAIAVFAFLWLSKADSKPQKTVKSSETLDTIKLSIISPIPQTLHPDPQKVLLGQKLFFDKGLSADQSVACASCHQLNLGGTDGLKTAKGIHNQLGSLNTPTVFNAAFNLSQNWDGRADTLSAQALGPLFSPIEMGNQKADTLLSYVKKQYLDDFKNLYQDGVTLNNLVDAIGEFEKTLITPNSKFDAYLKGLPSALTDTELAGYQRFNDLGCIACHNGINLGSNMYQKVGIFSDDISSPNDTSAPDRFTVTKNPSEKGFMKVPTLRNIALTAPYFHNGSSHTLQDAILKMGRAQLGKELGQQDLELLEAFLKTLTGEYQGKPLMSVASNARTGNH
ncbi:cytochrome-c peroxidase [Thiosulfativibrio zosterae]|uniref:Cytochrome c domain-containing protein n=1 Tax=Thiosulfativibrio zosterae TaxID=2675053 RepID=A0A6F8PLD2_9GAMM|nr:cytochrome-c peroxidase [Thiosulfativibrio zosterae]BBP42895.1 hypothetical protein THMIRHAT_06410 [Thiosulfativibrio zosterae]